MDWNQANLEAKTKLQEKPTHFLRGLCSSVQFVFEESCVSFHSAHSMKTVRTVTSTAGSLSWLSESHVSRVKTAPCMIGAHTQHVLSQSAGLIWLVKNCTVSLRSGPKSTRSSPACLFLKEVLGSVWHFQRRRLSSEIFSGESTKANPNHKLIWKLYFYVVTLTCQAHWSEVGDPPVWAQAAGLK